MSISLKRKAEDAHPQPRHTLPMPPVMSESQLPPINAIIAGDGILAARPPLDVNRKARLLGNAFGAVYDNLGCHSLLNKTFLSRDNCRSIIVQNPLFGTDETTRFVDVLDNCLVTNDWEPLFAKKGLLRNDLSSSQSSDVSLELNDFESAFKGNFVGRRTAFLRTIDDYVQRSDSVFYYNLSIAIIQSSGTGKSRLVNETAKLRFTLLFNLHPDVPPGSGIYPPFDGSVRSYLTQQLPSQKSARQRHAVFLETLFNETVTQLQNPPYTKASSLEIAQTWYNWMDVDATSTTVGTNRTEFYNRVIAASRLKESLGGSNRQDLLQAADRLVECLRRLYADKKNVDALAIVCFDEASTLRHPKPDHDCDPYFALMHVLSWLAHKPIFFVFLSTNSHLSMFARIDAEYPSLRVQRGHKIIPPYFELPFDPFCDRFTSILKEDGRLTLEAVCELEQIAKFGRPLWFSYYLTLPASEKSLVVALAMLKMGSNNFDTNHDAQLAALDCRVLIQYDPLNSNSRIMQTKLVKKYMRLLFNIPEDRNFMWSGYPSEPILAEAAARLLNSNKSHSIKEYAPEILCRALEGDLIARGERGELVARTLVTVAHDIAILNHCPKPTEGIHFHRPLPVLKFLEALCAPECWEVVRKARPVRDPLANLRGSSPSDSDDSDKAPTLEEAFKDARLNFSQFYNLGDHESFSLSFFVELLKRGVAPQAYAGQRDWDMGTPMQFGDPGTDIGIDTTSNIYWQIKNRTVADVLMQTLGGIGDVPHSLPILSIVLELGCEKPEQRARVQIEKARDDKSNPHYSITLYGCTHETFACIPKDKHVYATLLCGHKPMDDFSRRDSETSLESFNSLKPMLVKKEGVYTAWAS